MTVIFHSDGDFEKVGFNATYEEIDGIISIHLPATKICI